MDVGGYRHNNKGFCENFTFPKSINRGRTTDELDLGVFLVVVLNRFHAKIFIIPHFI